MKVTCDLCGCDMKIASSFRYFCPECKNEIEIQHIQHHNQIYREEHGRNIEWLKVRGDELIVAS